MPGLIQKVTELAGYSYSLATNKSGITLEVKGYSDKHPVLLDKIMDRLTMLKVDPKRFKTSSNSVMTSSSSDSIDLIVFFAFAFFYFFIIFLFYFFIFFYFFFYFIFLFFFF